MPTTHLQRLIALVQTGSTDSGAPGPAAGDVPVTDEVEATSPPSVDEPSPVGVVVVSADPFAV